jgi:hypothetical protein
MTSHASTPGWKWCEISGTSSYVSGLFGRLQQVGLTLQLVGQKQTLQLVCQKQTLRLVGQKQTLQFVGQKQTLQLVCQKQTLQLVPETDVSPGLKASTRRTWVLRYTHDALGCACLFVCVGAM